MEKKKVKINQMSPLAIRNRIINLSEKGEDSSRYFKHLADRLFMLTGEDFRKRKLSKEENILNANALIRQRNDAIEYKKKEEHVKYMMRRQAEKAREELNKDGAVDSARKKFHLESGKNRKFKFRDKKGYKEE